VAAEARGAAVCLPMAPGSLLSCRRARAAGARAPRGRPVRAHAGVGFYACGREAGRARRRYVQLQCAALARQQAELVAQLDALRREGRRAAAAAAAVPSRKPSAPAGGEAPGRCLRPAWLDGRAVAGVAAAAALLGGGHPLVRLARLAPLLCLLPGAGWA